MWLQIPVLYFLWYLLTGWPDSVINVYDVIISISLILETFR